MKNKLITRQFTSSQPSPIMANTILKIIQEWDKQAPNSAAKIAAKNGSDKTTNAKGNTRAKRPRATPNIG